MASRKHPFREFLQVTHLGSIKTKIIVFALLATIIPSVSMGWLSYIQNTKFLNDKITQELRDVTNQASRELDLWLKERIYEVRVLSSSYVVSENLEKLYRKGGVHVENIVALRRLKDYLESVRKKFIDYEELMLVDVEGNIVATSSGQVNGVEMPGNWLVMAKADKSIIGKPYWDDPTGAGVMVIAEPIRAVHDRLLGVFTAKLNFRTIGETLRNYVLGETGEIYLITNRGYLLLSSQMNSAKFLTTKLARAVTNDLFSKEAIPLDYVSYHGKSVVGTLKRVPQLDWGVVAEKERKTAYAQIVRLRNTTLTLVAGLLLGIGLCAYLLGLSIVRPLARLTKGADKVAAGDLEVDIPVPSRSEVGYLTEVFNHMVARLRQGREELANINATLREKNKELEELSITDSLTGLNNRKHLMEKLAGELIRSERYDRKFSVLMIDIDHFKRYNDTYGHLAGDEVLRRMAEVFRQSIRSSDYAARYGGEEFMLILPETGSGQGVQAAERIRRRVAEEKIGGEEHSEVVTVSVGVASFPENGDDSNSIISQADVALYRAKQAGRNQVILADSET